MKKLARKTVRLQKKKTADRQSVTENDVAQVGGGLDEDPGEQAGGKRKANGS